MSSTLRGKLLIDLALMNIVLDSSVTHKNAIFDENMDNLNDIRILDPPPSTLNDTDNPAALFFESETDIIRFL